MNSKSQIKQQMDDTELEDEDEEDESNNCDSNSDDYLSEDIIQSKLTYKPTDQERLKLVNMFIELIHDVPPQHEIEKTAGTRSLKKKQREEFENYIPLKSGTFSKKEDKKIMKNWKKFCKIYDWDQENVKPFLQMKYKNKVFYLSLRNRKKFVQFLANGLFDRSLYSVYQRFKVKFSKHKTKRYSSIEDHIILNYVNNYEDTNSKRKFADLAIVLKRTRHSIWRRYGILKKKYNLKDKVS